MEEDLLKLFREELIQLIDFESSLGVADSIPNPSFRALADSKHNLLKETQKKISEYKLPTQIVEVAMQLFGNGRTYEEIEIVAKKRAQLGLYKMILSESENLLSEEVVFDNCPNCMHFAGVNFNEFDEEGHIIGDFDRDDKPYCRLYDISVEDRVDGVVRSPCLDFEARGSETDSSGELGIRKKRVAIVKRVVDSLEKELENCHLKHHIGR